MPALSSNFTPKTNTIELHLNLKEKKVGYILDEDIPHGAWWLQIPESAHHL